MKTRVSRNIYTFSSGSSPLPTLQFSLLFATSAGRPLLRSRLRQRHATAHYATFSRHTSGSSDLFSSFLCFFERASIDECLQ